VARRKQRTRDHVIADLSENHFEKCALQKGFSVERTAHDYGYDVILFTYDKNGEIENGFVSVQLKATDKLNTINNNTTISFPVDKKDLDLWLNEFFPVIFVIYDAANEQGYWLYLQSYFNAMTGFSLTNVGKTFNIHIPLSNSIGKGAMTKFADFKSKRNKIALTAQHT